MFVKFKIRLLPNDNKLKALRALHEHSVEMNKVAQKELMDACDKSFCKDEEKKKQIFRCIG